MSTLSTRIGISLTVLSLAAGLSRLPAHAQSEEGGIERIVPSIQSRAVPVGSVTPPSTLDELDIDGGRSLSLIQSTPTDPLSAEARQLLAEQDSVRPDPKLGRRIDEYIAAQQKRQDALTRSGRLDEAVVVRDNLAEFRARLEGALPDPGNLTAYRGLAGNSYKFVVTGKTGGSIWGSDLYTDDSDLSTAAVHAGLLKEGQRGVVMATILAGAENYDAVERNGVSTQSYGQWSGSYSLQPVTKPQDTAKPLPVAAQRWLNVLDEGARQGLSNEDARFALQSLSKLQEEAAQAGKLDEALAIRERVRAFLGRLLGAQPAPRNLTDLRDQVGRVFYFIVTGRTSGTVWGSGIYTDDSDLGAAAVHAGLLHDGEKGIVKVTILPGGESYAGSVHNGVESAPYGPWQGSYTLQSVDSIVR